MVQVQYALTSSNHFLQEEAEPRTLSSLVNFPSFHIGCRDLNVVEEGEAGGGEK